MPSSKLHRKKLLVKDSITPTHFRALAERNSGVKGFTEKFHHLRSERIHESIPPTVWGQLLHAWRGKLNLYAKEAAAKLQIPFDTYRGWECGKHTPQVIVRQEMAKRMAAIKSAT